MVAMETEKLTKTEQFLFDEEGYSEKPYRCTNGKLTIGIGYNLDAGMPMDEAILLLKYRIGKIRLELLRRLEWFPKIGEARQAALISMAYQMGTGGLFGFKRTLGRAAVGDWENASREILESKFARQTPERAKRVAYMIRYGRFPDKE